MSIVLTCGVPKPNTFERDILNAMRIADPRISLPSRIGTWSTRSLYMAMRVLGAEIVVPDTRYVTVSRPGFSITSSTGDDVIIAQYVLTKTYSLPTKIHIRQEEYYPAVLYDFSESQIEAGMIQRTVQTDGLSKCNLFINKCSVRFVCIIGLLFSFVSVCY